MGILNFAEVSSFWVDLIYFKLVLNAKLNEAEEKQGPIEGLMGGE